MKIDKTYEELAARNIFTAKDIDWLCTLFYDVHLEGKKQVKDQLHNTRDKLLEAS